MKKMLAIVNSVLAIVLIVGFSGTNQVEAITNTLVPFNGNNDQGNGMIDRPFSVSTNGRFVAFISNSSDLVSGDVTNTWDAFVRDTKENVTTRVSVSSTGTPANAKIDDIKMSGNGRYILMTTSATNLVSPQQGHDMRNSIYLHDIKTSQTSIVGASSMGSIPGQSTGYKAIGLSEDGRFIYYNKNVDGNAGIFVKDRVSNGETRIDVDSNNAPADSSPSSRGDVSCDGRYVVFESSATNLTPNDTNATTDIFLADTMGHTIKNITTIGNASSYDPKITCDGNYIVFHSNASNLVQNDTNNYLDIIKYNIANEGFEIASLDSGNNQYSAWSVQPGVSTLPDFDVSMDGRWVAFSVYEYYQHPQQGVVRVRSRIQLRDTEQNTTTMLAGDYVSRPQFTYDGEQLYYAWSAQANDSFRRLYVAKDYL